MIWNPEAPMDDATGDFPHRFTPDPIPPRDKPSIWPTIIFAAILLACLGMLLYSCTITLAHVHGLSDEDNAWLAQQGSAVGICCTGSDALTLQDPNWVKTDTDHFLDIKDNEVHCETGSSQNNMTPPDKRAIKYCVLINDKWWAVPEGSVVKAPNRIGPAIVWPIEAQSGGQVNYIRCFLPGVES